MDKWYHSVFTIDVILILQRKSVDYWSWHERHMYKLFKIGSLYKEYQCILREKELIKSVSKEGEPVFYIFEIS